VFHQVSAKSKGKDTEQGAKLLGFAALKDKAQSSLAPWLHSTDRLKDNPESKIFELMKGAKFADSKKVAQRS
jgi:hypothetical protein